MSVKPTLAERDVAISPDMERLRDVDAYLVDFDNTLQVGDKLELKARLGEISLRLGMDFATSEIEAFGDRSDYREMRQLMVAAHNHKTPDHTVTEDEFQTANIAISGSFDHHFRLAPHARSFLENARGASKGMALVTTRGSNSIDRLLDRHEIYDYFDIIINRDSCETRKPDPMPFKLALTALGIEDPAAAAVVGDKQEDDIAGGIKVGALTVLVNPDLNPAAAQPDFHFDSLQPLARLYQSR